MSLKNNFKPINNWPAAELPGPPMPYDLIKYFTYFIFIKIDLITCFRPLPKGMVHALSPASDGPTK